MVGALAALLGPQSASAQVVENEYADYEAPPTERRGGFVIGLSGGPGLASVTGYPNQLSEINDPEFERNVDGLAVGGRLWVGGALRDWLTFAIGVAHRSALQGDLTATNQAIILRLEGFPAYSLGGEWKNLGAFGDFGAGGAIVHDDTGDDVADGGFMSVVGFGAFYEPWQLGQFSTGPELKYAHEFSESLRSHAVTLGLRVVFYGLQPR